MTSLSDSSGCWVNWLRISSWYEQ